MVLTRVSNVIQEKKNNILRSLVVVSGQLLAWSSQLLWPPSLVFLSVSYTILPRGPRDTLLFLPQKTQKPHEKILLLKSQDSQRMRKCVVFFREVRNPQRPWPL